MHWKTFICSDWFFRNFNLWKRKYRFDLSWKNTITRLILTKSPILFSGKGSFFLQVMMKSNEGMTLMFKIHWIHCKLQLRYCWLLHVCPQCWFSRISICFLKQNYYKMRYCPFFIIMFIYQHKIGRTILIMEFSACEFASAISIMCKLWIYHLIYDELKDWIFIL